MRHLIPMCIVAISVLAGFATASEVASRNAKSATNAASLVKRAGPQLLSVDDPLDSKSCDYKTSLGGDRCEISVEMSVWRDVCTASIKGYLRVPRTKTPTIVWTIDQKLAPTEKFEFAGNGNGIIILEDDDDQVKSGRHGHGDGVIAGGATQFFWVNKNSKADHTKIAGIVYLPIVVRNVRDSSTGITTMSLCRAIDPKIVNDGQ